MQACRAFEVCNKVMNSHTPKAIQAQRLSIFSVPFFHINARHLLYS